MSIRLHCFGTHDVRDGLDDTDVYYGYNYRDIRDVSVSFEDSEYAKASPSLNQLIISILLI